MSKNRALLLSLRHLAVTNIFVNFFQDKLIYRNLINNVLQAKLTIMTKTQLLRDSSMLFAVTVRSVKTGVFLIYELKKVRVLVHPTASQPMSSVNVTFCKCATSF